MRSRLVQPSRNVSPSGTTSTSWKQKNGVPSFSKNVEGGVELRSAVSNVSAACQGRSNVPGPNMSLPGQQNVCQ